MPPKQWVIGTYSQGRKQPGCSADHLPAFIGEIKNTKSSTSTLSCVFTVLYVIKHRDSFTLLTAHKNYHYIFLGSVTLLYHVLTSDSDWLEVCSCSESDMP